MANQLILNADILFDGTDEFQDVSIVIENENIIEINSGREATAKFHGFITPAFIDAHSHIGMERSGEPLIEGEVDEESEPIAPLSNPIDGIYFDDKCFSDAIDFGVLYSCIVPGSGNIIGGKAQIIKNYAKNRTEATIYNGHYGYKMALGYNPRSVPEYKGMRPNTRMGVYQMLEEAFDNVIEKREKSNIDKELALIDLELEAKDISDEVIIQRKRELILSSFKQEFTKKDQAIMELLDRKKTAKVHVHKEDDVYYLTEFVKKYKIKASAEHCCDVGSADVFNALAEANIPVVYGPMDSSNSKVELKNCSYKNAKALMDSVVCFGMMTDHPVVLAHSIRSGLRDFLIQGMSEAEVIGIITNNNAKILGMDGYGTIKPGKKASVIVWNKNPLHIGAYPVAVFAEGVQLR